MSDQDPQERLDQQTQARIEQKGAGAAAATAGQQVAKKTSRRKQNPHFFKQLQELGLDTDEYPWIEARLGPLQAGAHLIGNRSDEYEREAKWLDQNRGERIIAEGEPGRLCRGKLLSIAQRVHGRDDKERVDPMTADERRVVRDAMEGITNFKTLSIENTGLSSVTDATTVQKSEESTEEQSMAERTSRFIG